MDERRPRARLGMAIALSLVMHALVILPLFMATLEPRITRSMTDAVLTAQRAEVEIPENEVQLGIEESAESTLTWVGYDTYEEHMATLSAVEQSAFTLSPEQGVPTEVAGDLEAPTTPVEAAQPVEAPETAEEVVDASSESPEESVEVEEPLDVTATSEPMPSAVQSMMALLNLAEKFAPVFEVETPADPVTDKPVTTPRETPPATVAQNVTQPKPVAAAEPPRPAPKPGDEQADEPLPGEVSDRQSPATSTVEFTKIKAGKTVSAQGMELKPKKPELTTFQRLTSRPCDPVVLMQFRKDGTVKHAEILTASCSPGFDASLLASLYDWKAKGEPIDALDGDELVTIRMQILLQ
ncbi:MAG: hypothetical protein AAF432_03045 [Planctomycetota bacterium]